LKSSQQRLHLFFKPHLNRRSTNKSYEPPKSRESQLRKFWDSQLRVLRQNDIWVLVPWLGTKYTIRGKVVASLSLGFGEFCESMFACSSSVHQKCSNYALTNLLFGLCKSMWVIELLVNFSSPHPEATTSPLPPKCCELGNAPQLLFLPLFSLLDLQWIH
jgi:hypothetical protein